METENLGPGHCSRDASFASLFDWDLRLRVRLLLSLPGLSPSLPASVSRSLFLGEFPILLPLLLYSFPPSLTSAKINTSFCKAGGVLTPPPPQLAVLKALRLQGITSPPCSPFCCQVPPLCPLNWSITPGLSDNPPGKVAKRARRLISGQPRPRAGHPPAHLHCGVNASLAPAAEGTRGTNPSVPFFRPPQTHTGSSAQGASSAWSFAASAHSLSLFLCPCTHLSFCQRPESQLLQRLDGRVPLRLSEHQLFHL